MLRPQNARQCREELSQSIKGGPRIPMMLFSKLRDENTNAQMRTISLRLTRSPYVRLINFDVRALVHLGWSSDHLPCVWSPSKFVRTHIFYEKYKFWFEVENRSEVPKS